MKIDWFKLNKEKHVLAWFMIEAMTRVGIDEFKNEDGKIVDHDGMYDLVLTVNGVEVPVDETFDNLNNQLERIEQTALQCGRKQGYQDAIEKLNENIDKILDIPKDVDDWD